MSNPALMLKQLGKPIVDAAFNELLASDIPTETGREILTKFRKMWKDYARPALMILSCEAVGGNPKLVEPAAKAIILMSGALDIHDDIIDKSYERTEKHTKTLLGIYGNDAMLLAGDALIIGAYRHFPAMNDIISHDNIKRTVEIIVENSIEMGSSVYDELKFIRNCDVTPQQYLHNIRMKAADIESCTKIGAILGGADEETITSFAEFGRLLGMIVMLRDDIQDTFNDIYELKTRILNERLPLPILFALPDADLCDAILSTTPDSSDQEIQKIIDLIEKHKGFEKTRDVIEKMIVEMFSLLEKYPNTEKMLSLIKKRGTKATYLAK